MIKVKKRWWRVTTGTSGSESGKQELGVFHGYVDDIALRLADKQEGFWSKGLLEFTPVGPPSQLRTKRLQEQANVGIRLNGILNWVDQGSLNQARQFFKGRPVEVTECNLYGAITITRKGHKRLAKRED